MDVLFKDVHEELAKLKEIRWVDEDCGQLDIYEKPPVVFPCALISVQVPEWIGIKEPAVQPGKAEVIIKIGFNVLQPVGNAPASQLKNAFDHFSIVKQITKALRGKHGALYKGLERISTIKTVNEVGVKIYTVTFITSMAEVIE